MSIPLMIFLLVIFFLIPISVIGGMVAGASIYKMGQVDERKVWTKEQEVVAVREDDINLPHSTTVASIFTRN